MRINIKVRWVPCPYATLDLDPSATIADLKVALEKATGWRVSRQRARLKSAMITHDAVTLEQYGMKDGDMVVMEVREPTGFLAELEELQRMTPQEYLDVFHAGLRAQVNDRRATYVERPLTPEAHDRAHSPQEALRGLP